MKQVHLIDLEQMGGVERLLLQYVNYSSDQQNIILCISNNIATEIQCHIIKKKVYFPNRLFNNLPIRCPKFLRKYWLSWKISKISADFIIVWDFIPEFSIKPKNTQLLYYDHGSSWRYTINTKIMRFFGMLDGIISVSKASKRVMELRFNLSCAHLVVLNRLTNPIGINYITKSLSQPVRLGTASRLVSLKGISVSLLTLHELIIRGHNIILEIAGKGPERTALELLTNKLKLNNHVIFSGFQKDMSIFFNRIDIYMSTPISESFGLSCMEALYYGIPVIFPIIDGQPEVICNGICGIGIYPTVSIKNHQNLSGIKINFPYHVYDPVSDVLVQPKLLSHIKCADAVEELIIPKNYHQFSHNAKLYTINNFSYDSFQKKFQKALNAVHDKKQ
ncbi:glycosyltransferase [Candidatus Erwinia haradaeae]|uniref:Glycosyl transferase group 1 family protein n=1 Tax=Candidatus Erwinia haradaeae TaxID=1922217 RepID=A0A451DIF7_9GAMM|nr:glycosyltransferase [Candidatus Erwinia haradaeae]VFP86449.1 Glycosyl transferase group 1 family protein [Candidatus Erwinia haradaeae]